MTLAVNELIRRFGAAGPGSIMNERPKYLSTQFLTSVEVDDVDYTETIESVLWFASSHIFFSTVLPFYRIIGFTTSNTHDGHRGTSGDIGRGH